MSNKEMEKQKQQYQLITDIWLEAYLKILKFPIAGTKRIQNRINFLVPKSPELTKAIMVFYDRTGKVSALDYSENFRSLRSFFHQTLELEEVEE